MIYRHMLESTKTAKGIQFAALSQGRHPLAMPKMPPRLPTCRTERGEIAFS
jgi:hypothetical protein